MGPITEAVKDIFALIPNPNDRAKAQEAYDIAVQQAAAQADAGQRQINLAEAQSGNWFNSGWRPAVGWVCAASLATYYLPQNIMAAILWTKLAWASQSIPPYPITLSDALWQLMLGMLGMGALRSYDKKNGVAK